MNLHCARCLRFIMIRQAPRHIAIFTALSDSVLSRSDKLQDPFVSSLYSMTPFYNDSSSFKAHCNLYCTQWLRFITIRQTPIPICLLTVLRDSVLSWFVKLGDSYVSTLCSVPPFYHDPSIFVTHLYINCTQRLIFIVILQLPRPICLLTALRASVLLWLINSRDRFWYSMESFILGTWVFLGPVQQWSYLYINCTQILCFVVIL